MSACRHATRAWVAVRFLARTCLAVLLAGALPLQASLAQEKHALLFIGELSLSKEEEAVARNLLVARQYTVHVLRTDKPRVLFAKIDELAALSRDPSGPGWSRFAFYYMGHGGAGFMALYDANDNETSTLFTDEVALRIFNGVVADGATFVFDMCEAALAVPLVRSAIDQDPDPPAGWILAAAGNPTGPDDGVTYDSRYTKVLADCLSAAGPGAVAADSLGSCMVEKRWRREWWWHRSLPSVQILNVLQQPGVPVF